MTATTANTNVVAMSAPARFFVGLEVILGTGWLIVVFGALSVHLAPRLEQIAARLNERSSGRQPTSAGAQAGGGSLDEQRAPG